MINNSSVIFIILYQFATDLIQFHQLLLRFRSFRSELYKPMAN